MRILVGMFVMDNMALAIAVRALAMDNALLAIAMRALVVDNVLLVMYNGFLTITVRTLFMDKRTLAAMEEKMLAVAVRSMLLFTIEKID